MVLFFLSKLNPLRWASAWCKIKAALFQLIRIKFTLLGFNTVETKYLHNLVGADALIGPQVKIPDILIFR